MPKKHILTAAEIDTIDRELITMGYQEMTWTNVQKEKERLDYEAPRLQEGIKIPYSHSDNHYEARVYPSILFETSLPANSSAAWAMIREHDRTMFFSPRIHRTDNFVYNFLGWAEITMALVKHRPLCPDKNCRDIMHIDEEDGIYRGYRWICVHRELHYLPETCIVDLMSEKIYKTMSSRAQDVWKTYHSKLKSYIKKLDTKGQKPGKARNERLPHHIGRPQNVH